MTPERSNPAPLVGKKIRQLRKDRKLTQSELASRIGIQQSDLCRMETGEYKVSLEALFKILRIFGLSIADFFHDEVADSPIPEGRRAELLNLFDRLQPQHQDEVLDFMRYKVFKEGQKEDRR